MFWWINEVAREMISKVIKFQENTITSGYGYMTRVGMDQGIHVLISQLYLKGWRKSED